LFWRDDTSDVEHSRGLFTKIGIVAGAGQRILAPCRGLLALGAHLRDIFLYQTLFERRPSATGGFDFLELFPGRGA